MIEVIKVGGNELDTPAFLPALAEALAKKGGETIVVHGGGRTIAELQAAYGLETRKVDGLRVTDAASLALAEMALSGAANKKIVRALLRAGLDALGVSGVDGGLLRCTRRRHGAADLGFVGQVVSVRVELLQTLLGNGFTPVVSPISLGPEGAAYNVNADEAAAALAAAVGAGSLTFISNVPGVLREGQPVPRLDPATAATLIADGTIAAGMVPKVQAALAAVAGGVPRARIVDLAGFHGDAGTVVVGSERPAGTPSDRMDS